MPIRRIAVLALSLAIAATRAAAGPPPAPTGRWLTQDGDAVIEVLRCGDALCGRIVGMRLDHPTDPAPVDWRGNSQCGLMILNDAQPEDDGWFGRITDPSNGSVWQVRLTAAPDGTLHLRGYVGIPLLGQTQVWTHYTGPVPSDCRLPGATEASPDRHPDGGNG